MNFYNVKNFRQIRKSIMKYISIIIVLTIAFLFLTSQSFGQEKTPDFYELTEARIGNFISQNLKDERKKRISLLISKKFARQKRILRRREFLKNTVRFLRRAAMSRCRRLAFLKDEDSVKQISKSGKSADRNNRRRFDDFANSGDECFDRSAEKKL